MAKILVMDDNDLLRASPKTSFSFLGYDVIAVETGQEVIKLLLEGVIFDVAFFDIENEKGLGGIETIEEMKKSSFVLFPIFVMSGNSTHDAILNPESYGFEKSFKKSSMRLQNLQDAVEEALKKAGA